MRLAGAPFVCGLLYGHSVGLLRYTSRGPMGTRQNRISLAYSPAHRVIGHVQEPEHEGGLGMGVATAGMVMLVQGLLSTVLGPLIGRAHDRTTKKRLLFAILPTLLLTLTYVRHSPPCFPRRP